MINEKYQLLFETESKELSSSILNGKDSFDLPHLVELLQDSNGKLSTHEFRIGALILSMFQQYASEAMFKYIFRDTPFDYKHMWHR